MNGFASGAIKCVSILGLAAVLGACASSNPRYVPSVPPGSAVEVKESLQIPDGRARVFIQNGAVVSQNAVDIFSVYCAVSMNKLHQSGEPPLVVEPERFRITEVRQYNSINRAHRVYVANSGGNFEYPANVVYYVDMRLQAENPSDVRALICMKHNNPAGFYDARIYYPSLAEIDATLGDVIEIE